MDIFTRFGVTSFLIGMISIFQDFIFLSPLLIRGFFSFSLGRVQWLFDKWKYMPYFPDNWNILRKSVYYPDLDLDEDLDDDV